MYFLGCWRQSFIAKVFCEPLAGSTYECRAHIVIVPDTDCQVSATACMQAVSMYYSYNWIYVYPHSTDASASLIDNLTHSRDSSQSLPYVSQYSLNAPTTSLKGSIVDDH